MEEKKPDELVNDLSDEDLLQKMIEEENNENNNKIFQKFKIKDFVFLAIISAITIATSAIMPLVKNIPIFGMIQLCLGLQFSIFPTIGLMKVRKVGSMLFMAILIALVLTFMAPIMGACIAISGLIAEGLNLIIFRGYKKDVSCLLTGFIFLPISMPFLYVWYLIIGGEDTVVTYFNQNIGLSIGMIFIVLAVALLGATLGMIISKELRKAGVLKN